MSLFLSKWARLYTRQTPSERSLEPAIAALGIPYRAQHPEFRLGVILDFALLGPRIAIEVDGPDHNQPAKKEADRLRTQRLEGLGWRVVRCTNAQALSDPHRAVREMLEGLQERLELGLPGVDGVQEEQSTTTPPSPQPARTKKTRRPLAY